jgi:biopolymer transport protein ExbB/TolQ
MSEWKKQFEEWKEHRLFYIVVGIISGLVLIGFLTIILTRGSALAKLLIDFQSKGNYGVFPYPFTIQNVMWIMFGVAIGDSVYRNKCANSEKDSIALGLLPESQNAILTQENLPDVMEKAYVLLQKQGIFLARVIHSTGMSFQTHASAAQAHEVMSSQVDIELHRSDLKYTLLRYIAWLLPTLGFIGTVVGISSALAAIDVSKTPQNPTHLSGKSEKKGESTEKKAQKKSASSEDVTSKLGLAFNTTILALIQSVVVVLLSQFLQKKEEQIINEQAEYCLNNLIVRLYNPNV